MASGSTLIDVVTPLEMVTGASFNAGGEGPQVVKYQTTSCKCHENGPTAKSGRAICGLVALNCVRLAYKSWAEGIRDLDLLRLMISQSTVNQEILRITYDLETDKPLDVNELLKIPIFGETISSTQSAPHIASYDDLKTVLSGWFSSSTSDLAAIAFHRRTELEIAVCLRIPISGSAIYAVFDPHARPNHPHGPAFVLSTQLEEIVAYPQQRLLLSPSTSTPQVISGYLLQPRVGGHLVDAADLIDRSKPHLMESTKSPSEASSLHECDMSFTTNNNDHFDTSGFKLTTRPRKGVGIVPILPLENYVANLVPEFGSHRSCQKPAPQPLLNSSLFVKDKENIPLIGDDSDGLITLLLTDEQLEIPIYMESSRSFVESEGSIHSGAGPSRLREFKLGKTVLPRDTVDEGPLTPEDQPSKRLSRQNAVKKCGRSSDDKTPSRRASPTQHITDGSWELALLRQLQEEEEIAASVAHHVSSNDAWRVALQKRVLEEETFNHGHEAFPSSGISELDWQLAFQLQEEEGVGRCVFTNTRRPSSSSSTIHLREDSLNNMIAIRPRRPTFDCGICGDTHDDAEKISIPDCNHHFCRECLCSHVRTKIEDGRFPIFCPECSADRQRPNKSHVSEQILDNLDLSQQNRDRLIELQLIAHSVILQCPRCQESMNVDREEYAEQRVIICPLPRCGHKWCKSCLKTLASSNDRHRCKNDNIDRLMRRKGWKYCPGCRTPVQKESGCNHMTCSAPGCNVHFCYKCGAFIVDTTNGGDVGMTVTEHYNNCRLFERRFSLCSIQ